MDEFREFHLEDERPIVVAHHHVNSVKGGNRTVVRTTDGDWFQITESYAEVRAWLLGGERKAAESRDVANAFSEASGTETYSDYAAGWREAERHHGIGGGRVSAHTSGPTPGPWFNDAGLVCGRDSRPAYAGSPSIDIFNAAEWPAELDAEARANARLIAAAPELLAALRHYAFPGPYTGRPSDEEIRTQARALISKVDGFEG